MLENLKDDDNFQNYTFFKRLVAQEKEDLRTKYNEMYFLSNQRKKMSPDEHNGFWTQYYVDKVELDKRMKWLRRLVYLKYKDTNNKEIKKFWGEEEDL
jgi:hypothetical protein